jgi:hypothetical protein
VGVVRRAVGVSEYLVYVMCLGWEGKGGDGLLCKFCFSLRDARTSFSFLQAWDSAQFIIYHSDGVSVFRVS